MNQLPPPPPRRIVPLSSPSTSTSTSTTSSTTASSSNSFWSKTKQLSSASWNGLYKVSDVVGGWSNTQTAKLGVEAFYPTSLDIESSKAARILRTFTMDLEHLPEEALVDIKKTQKVIKQIPPAAIRECEGLAIFTIMRTGFMVSGASGSGIVISRLPDGSWSAPSGILLHTVGIGFMIGVDVVDVCLILRTRSAVESFLHPRVSLGGEISISAGPVGNGFMLESSIDTTPIWSYVKSKGLWGGASVVGSILIERNDENKRSYGREVTAAEILSGQVSIPYWVEGLHHTILAAEGKAHLADRIPRGPSASQSVQTIEPRRLPPEELDDEDLKARKEMEAMMVDFGIEDPTINDQLRQEDALLLQGEDLDILTSPDFPNTRSGTGSATSSLYHQPSNLSSPLRSTTTPPHLPPRIPISPQSINHSHSLSTASNSNSSLNIITTHSNGLLTEVLEHPPTNDSDENLLSANGGGGGGGGIGRRSSLDKPPVPPRRSRNLEGSISGLNSPVTGGGEVVESEKEVEEEKVRGEEVVKEATGEEPKVDEAKAEEGKVEEAKVEEGKAEEVKAELPQVEAAKVESESVEAKKEGEQEEKKEDEKANDVVA